MSLWLSFRLAVVKKCVYYNKHFHGFDMCGPSVQSTTEPVLLSPTFLGESFYGNGNWDRSAEATVRTPSIDYDVLFITQNKTGGDGAHAAGALGCYSFLFSSPCFSLHTVMTKASWLDLIVLLL